MGRGSGAAWTFGFQLARLLLGEGCDFFGVPFRIDGVGIVVVADSFGELSVAFVLGFLDGVRELGIAPGTADVLGRATPADLDQARIEHARIGIEQALDLDRVLPAVAKVVEVLRKRRRQATALRARLSA